MKIIAIILLILQAISLFGSVINGNISGLFLLNNAYSVGQFVGFFFPTIIAIILLIISSKKKH